VRVRREHCGVPATRPTQRRSDLKLLIGAAVGVLLGGVVIAAAILTLMGRGKAPDLRQPQPFGLESDVHATVRSGGPVNYAGLSGDDGFWLATEDHKLVALLVKQPKPADCTLRWRGSKNTFTCNDKPVAIGNLARYRSFTSHTGDTKGLYMVALRDVLPPPDGYASSGG
jgi:hypothetical protein